MTSVAVAASVVAAPVGVITLDPDLFKAFSFVLGVLGVVLARMVFIGQENRKLNRRQTLRETLPLTGVALVIAIPLMYRHLDVIVLPPFIGVSVGYATMLFLKIAIRVSVSVARNVALEVADALKDVEGVTGTPADEAQLGEIIDRIDKKDQQP